MARGEIGGRRGVREVLARWIDGGSEVSEHREHAAMGLSIDLEVDPNTFGGDHSPGKVMLCFPDDTAASDSKVSKLA